jgi:hypothetical protein
MFRPTIFTAILIVVTEIPGFSREDLVTAASARDVASTDSEVPLAPLSLVDHAIPTSGRLGLLLRLTPGPTLIPSDYIAPCVFGSTIGAPITVFMT